MVEMMQAYQRGSPTPFVQGETCHSSIESYPFGGLVEDTLSIGRNHQMLETHSRAETEKRLALAAARGWEHGW